MMPTFNTANLGAMRNMWGGTPAMPTPGFHPTAGGTGAPLPNGTPSYPTGFNPGGVVSPPIQPSNPIAYPQPIAGRPVPQPVAPVAPVGAAPGGPVSVGPQPPAPIGPARPVWNQGGMPGGQTPQFNPQQLQQLMALRQMYQPA
jgi:hypothetical protein